MRSLVHILERRATTAKMTWTHVKAHNHHPWNEVVDRLAKFASTAGHAVPNCAPWITWIRDAPMLTALQWIWFYERLREQPLRCAPDARELA